MPLPVRERLFSTDPYTDFSETAFELDLHGWGSEHPVFRQVLAEVRPTRIIEVGTWKGASAVHMARCVRELALETEIVCVDTWMGAVEFWNDKQDRERYLSLKLKNGYPSVYYQFLANVVLSGFRGVITPFPQTSQIAARWFRNHGVSADVIYIDGSHEEEDVLADLRAYWPLLNAKGILFGDDFDEIWPGVRSAVRRFCREYNLTEEIRDGKWIVRKPEGVATAEAAESERLDVATAVRFEVISEQMVFLVHRANIHDQRLAHYDAHLRDKDGAIYLKDQQLAEANRLLQESASRMEAVHQQLQQSRMEVETLKLKLGGLERWFARFRNSRTWRWLGKRTFGRAGTPFD